MNLSLIKSIGFGLALSLGSAASANTVTVTLGAPGEQQVDLAAIGATGALVETFDTMTVGNAPSGSVLGTYSAGRVDATNRYGGADNTNFVTTQNSPGTLLTLNDDATYFGLWWSAGSVNNTFDLISNGVSIFQFKTEDVLEYVNNSSNGSQYFGNPTPNYQGQVGHEPFAFINFFSDTAFDSVLLSGPNFESDNHTIATSFDTVTGVPISPVPLPASLPLLAAALFGAGVIARRRKA